MLMSDLIKSIDQKRHDLQKDGKYTDTLWAVARLLQDYDPDVYLTESEIIDKVAAILQDEIEVTQ
jgi:hypothetical protein